MVFNSNYVTKLRKCDCFN